MNPPSPTTPRSLPTVIAIGYDAGLVESTCLRIDAVWAGLRFTHPKPGNVDTNSYGTLTDRMPDSWIEAQPSPP